MRSTRELKRLASGVAGRLNGYRDLAIAARVIGSGGRDRRISHVCINLQNTWGEFCRAYALSSARRPARLSGGVISLGAAHVRSEQDVVVAAMQRFRPRVYVRGNWSRRDEPAWHDPNTLLGTMQVVGASNLNDIRAALSLGSSVFDDLPIFRNFYAHRTEHTAIKARGIAYRYGIPRLDHPTDILCCTPPRASQSIMGEWIDDIWVTVQMLCA